VPFFFKLIMERRLGEPRSTEEIKQEAAHAREMHAKPAHTHAHHTPRLEGADD
jgi:hypothetical protein